MSEKDFPKIVEEHYDRIFRAARFMCADPMAAEELVQETFLAAAQSLRSFKGRSSIYTWLYSILLNKFRRWLRRKEDAAVSLQAMAEEEESEHSEETLETPYPGPGENAEHKETVERVRAAIRHLTADHRSAITLRYIEGMSYGEIAQTLGCPIGTVKSRIHYALQKIARHLAEPPHTQAHSPPPALNPPDGRRH